jgi:hypothetical protein
MDAMWVVRAGPPTALLPVVLGIGVITGWVLLSLVRGGARRCSAGVVCDQDNGHGCVCRQRLDAGAKAVKRDMQGVSHS